ncbi:MAG: hypothetical protein IJT51_08885 [Bacteroidales bacterium]|nr:hypothetical protein [Bacteroidales bacterium]
MKKLLVLSAITIFAVCIFGSCKKDTHDCVVRWTVVASNVSGVESAIEMEKNQIYKVYDDHFSKANFGTVDKVAHKIDITEVTNNKIEKIKTDSKKYALKANDELANFHPTKGTYTVSVVFEGEDGNETMATYTYEKAAE